MNEDATLKSNFFHCIFHSREQSNLCHFKL